jgi:DNA-binding transcriptional MerR regulator
MSDQRVSVDVPDKPSFKSSEVCELLAVPAYVLRTWESEFGDLGATKSPASARTYRRQDVELALRIKELVFVEHLTLAGVRRRLEQEGLLKPPVEEPNEAAGPAPALAEPARARIAQVKDELRSLLETLARDAHHEAAAAAGAAPSREAEKAADAGSAVASRPRGERAPSKVAVDATPVLPGLGEQDGSTGLRVAADPAEPHQAQLDPAALDFATIASPPVRSATRRSRVKPT